MQCRRRKRGDEPGLGERPIPLFPSLMEARAGTHCCCVHVVVCTLFVDVLFGQIFLSWLIFLTNYFTTPKVN